MQWLQWSKVLADCIVSTTPGASERNSVSKIPVEAEPAALRLLLKLIYSAVPQISLQQLFMEEISAFKAVILLSHKLDMPMVLERFEQFLVSAALQDIDNVAIWGTPALAVEWTVLACNMGMDELLDILEEHLMRHATEVLACQEAKELPSECLLRLSQGILHLLQTAKIPGMGHCACPGGGYRRTGKKLTRSDLEAMLGGGKTP